MIVSDIGGNTTAILQVQSENGADEIGNPVISWEEAGSYPGWLDLVSGNSPVQNYNAKISESSHYYITDYYRALANQDPEVCRILIDGKIYDVQWIDDPMGMHEHLEIYLKAVGGVGRGADGV